MSKWCKIEDIEIGEFLINLDDISFLRKSYLCDKRPTIEFSGDSNDFTCFFNSEEERDAFYDNLKIKLDVIG